MQKTIWYQGVEVPYTLTYKTIKNLYAHVQRDGHLAVSAPYGCGAQTIERFLLPHLPRLLQAMQTAEKVQGNAGIEDKKIILLFGQKVTLRLLHGKESGVCREGDFLLLYRPAESPASDYQMLLDDYFRRMAEALLGEMCCRIYAAHFSGAFPYPTIRYRSMVSRWGSCRPNRGVITLNTRLLMAPPAAISYVVLHELVHMQHPGHGADFYAAVAACMPDYQKQVAVLKEIAKHSEYWI